jgi:hypothetical protein
MRDNPFPPPRQGQGQKSEARKQTGYNDRSMASRKMALMRVW